MKAEILRSIEKRLLKQPLDQAELLAVARQLQEILGYVSEYPPSYDPKGGILGGLKNE